MSASAAGQAVAFARGGGWVVQAVVAVALPSAVGANTLMASRVGFALARDGAVPAVLGRVNAGGTPGVSLLATAATVALCLATGTFERVIAVCAVLFVASYALSFAAVFALRCRAPAAARPYRTGGHPWTTALVLAGSVAFLAGSVAFLAGTVVADPRTGRVALARVALSYPVFRVLGIERAARPRPALPDGAP